MGMKDEYGISYTKVFGFAAVITLMLAACAAMLSA